MASSALGGLPDAATVNLNQISFIPNQGQISQDVIFYHQGPRNHIFFTKSKIALLASVQDGTRAVELIPEKIQEQCRIIGAEPLSGKVSYLKGEPSQWKQNLPTYGSVVYQEVWPGIDLKFYAAGSQLEYDLIVAPGADPKAIRFALNGGGRLEVGSQGELIVSADGQRLLVQKHPVAYQEIAGVRREVEARFVVDGLGYGLTVADYDRTRPLVIDPLVFSMYVGGSAQEFIRDLAIDASGYIYVVGSSASTDYPVLTALQDEMAGQHDCVITRFAPDGSSIHRSTYLGGDLSDGCSCVAVRGDGEVIVTGSSRGGTFPVSATGVVDSTHNGSGFDDIFVARLPYDLSSLRWATYVGGYEDEYTTDLALDDDDNIYVIGYTESGGTEAPFPTTAGAFQTSLVGWQDAVVFRLKNDGSALDFSTFIGGTDGNKDAYYGDDGQAIAVTSNAIYIAGNAYGNDFPTIGFFITPPSLSGVTDVFYGRLTLTGTPLYLSLLGGSAREIVYGLAMAPGEDYFVLTGYTWSTDFPNLDGYDTSHNGATDVFVAGLEIYSVNMGGHIYYQSSPQFATLLGGSQHDSGEAIAIGGDGSIFVGGNTDSSNFPVKRAVDTSFNGGSQDVVVTKLSADASALLWSTYLGGSEFDYFTSLVLEQSGAVVGTAYTLSDDFPTVKPATNLGDLGEFKGSYDGVLFKVAPNGTSTAPFSLLLTSN